MTNSWWRKQGPFVPYPSPIAIPTPGVIDDPRIALCLNEDWMAVVLGVCKVLQRPETWSGSDNDVQAAIQQAMEIPNNLIAGCTPSGPPPAGEWCQYFDFTNNSGGWSLNLSWFTSHGDSAVTGSWVAGVGWVGPVHTDCTGGTCSQAAIGIELNLGALYHFTGIEVWATRPDNGTYGDGIIIDTDGTVNTGGGYNTNHYAQAYASDHGDIFIYFGTGKSYGSPPVALDAPNVITAVKFTGTGDNPFAGSNC